MECGCVRSPTGKCIGWHALSEEEYQNELVKLQAEEARERCYPKGRLISFHYRRLYST